MRALLASIDGSASFVLNVTRVMPDGAVGFAPKDGHAATSIVRDRDPLTYGSDVTGQRTQRRSAINELQIVCAKFECGNTAFHCFVDRVHVIVDTTKESRVIGFDRKFQALKLTFLVVECGPINALCNVVGIRPNENTVNGHVLAPSQWRGHQRVQAEPRGAHMELISRTLIPRLGKTVAADLENIDNFQRRNLHDPRIPCRIN